MGKYRISTTDVVFSFNGFDYHKGACALNYNKFDKYIESVMCKPFIHSFIACVTHFMIKLTSMELQIY